MKTYSVYFRTGGTANFRWQYVLKTFSTREEAAAKVSELERGGYAAHYAYTDAIRAVGLPETYA